MARDAIIRGPICFASRGRTITAFLRISTNRRAFAAPLSTKEASSIVTEWLERPQTILLTPGEKHWAVFQKLLESGQATGPLVMDAHLLGHNRIIMRTS